MTVDLAQPIPVHGYQVACAGGVLEGETILALAAEQGAAGGCGASLASAVDFGQSAVLHRR